MKSEDLAAFLLKNPDEEVLLASDAEGNSFSSVAEAYTAYVLKDYSGGETDEVFDVEDVVDAADPDEAVMAHLKRVVVIYPA